MTVLGRRGLATTKGNPRRSGHFGLRGICSNWPIFHPKARNNVASVKFNQRKGTVKYGCCASVNLLFLVLSCWPSWRPAHQRNRERKTNVTQLREHTVITSYFVFKRSICTSIYRAGTVPAVCFLMLAVVHGRAHDSLQCVTSPAPPHQLPLDAATILTSPHLHHSAGAARQNTTLRCHLVYL